MKKNILNSQFSILNSRKGFTLIELIVSIFIFSMITVATVSIFVSTTKSYQKARAIKSVKENSEFALNSIAKDVRMGKIETTDANCTSTTADNRKNCFMLTRNRNQMKTCYRVANAYLGVQESVSGNTCSSSESDYKKIVDLSGTGMSFDTDASGFYSLATDPPTSPTRRGWVEINLSIKSDAGKEMETDQIDVQTIVSSRDYGWENL